MEQPCCREYSRLKVLVVDDAEDVADTCSMLIEFAGHQAHIAYSGLTALELAEEIRPKVILTDIGLPDIDGYQLAQRIRSTEWGATVVLVAITGWGETDRKERSLEAGFSHHLVKPVAPESIELLLKSIASRA